ncbi:MAG: glycoside hydrolase family 5 protein [Lachnospiraceae bacterium]|nr:glycoside hydrolase family 5 protein [Candidatus Merdinaster equi]
MYRCINKHVIKIIAVTLAVFISLVGCAGENTAPRGEGDMTVEQQNGDVVVGDKEDIADSIRNLDLTDVDAQTLTKDYLGNGINLGNTMEAYGRKTLGIDADVASYERIWGQPITTAAMLKGMKNCGFDTVRIPVAWTNMMDYTNGDYSINPKLLDRVQEIVDYALDAQMFVIVNDHWDGGWWAMFGSSDEQSAQNAYTMYVEMWKQIAERFKDYPDALIFESANEELGDGLNRNSEWPDSGSLTRNECYEMTNNINQVFVDTIRSSGGNNADRFLLIAGFNTDFALTCDSRYNMPKDTVSGKLLLSVHYYTPWNYCGAEKDARWGLRPEYEEMDKNFASLTRFTDEGYGIIIGEYGALPVYERTTKSYQFKQNTIEYTTHLLDNCDKYNYCPLLWSCNDFYNKKTCEMQNDELAKLFSERCLSVEKAAGEAYLKQVEERMEEATSGAPEMWGDVEIYEPGTPVAWIMWNGGAGTFSVGNSYNPADNTMGIHAHNAVVEGAGEYVVSLDFDEPNTGLTFAALAIADGENLFPGCVIDITEITYDGVAVDLIANPYTCSDDGKCTRVNLLNEWVGEAPATNRTADGSSDGLSPIILDKTQIKNVRNITIKFNLIVP